MTRYADIADLEAVSRRIRGRVVRMTHTAKSPHVAAALSCVDLLVAAYGGVLKIDPQRPEAPEQDRFVLSDGRAAAALYAVLAERGFFSINRLDDYGRDGGSLPDPMTAGCVPGIEAVPGAPGGGLAQAAELALAARGQKSRHRVFVLLSDSECERGAVWESALMGAAEHLGRLTAIVEADRPEASHLPPLDARWRAFGWRVQRVDGHDVGAIIEALAADPTEVRPRCLIAATTSGKGVSFMEGDDAWRDRPLTPRDLAAALAELRSML